MSLVTIKTKRSIETGFLRAINQYPLGKAFFPQHVVQDDSNGLSFHAPDALTICMPPMWKEYSDTVCDKACHLIIGSKGLGKSTLAKHLVNRWASSLYAVYYLDLDPGQPEFSPPGLISLYRILRPDVRMTTACPEQQDLLRRHWIGETSAKDDPHHYLACVADLIKMTDEERGSFDRSCTVVVNTPGWIKGTGKDLTIEICRLLLDSFKNDLKVVALGHVPLASELPSCHITSLPGHDTTGVLGPTAADLRTLNILGYFHRREAACEALQWYPGSLSSIPRWSVTYGGPEFGQTAGICGISVLRQSLQREHFIHAILGTIVAVCITQQLSLQTTRSPEGIPIMQDGGEPLDPSQSFCLGLALISGINCKTREIELITPISADTLEQAGHKIVLVTGSIEVPPQMMISAAKSAQKGNDEQIGPYLTDKPGEGIGWQNWHVRRNIGRRVRNT